MKTNVNTQICKQMLFTRGLTPLFLHSSSIFSLIFDSEIISHYSHGDVLMCGIPRINTCFGYRIPISQETYALTYFFIPLDIPLPISNGCVHVHSCCVFDCVMSVQPSPPASVCAAVMMLLILLPRKLYRPLMNIKQAVNITTLCC